MKISFAIYCLLASVTAEQLFDQQARHSQVAISHPAISMEDETKSGETTAEGSGDDEDSGDDEGSGEDSGDDEGSGEEKDDDEGSGEDESDEESEDETKGTTTDTAMLADDAETTSFTCDPKKIKATFYKTDNCTGEINKRRTKRNGHLRRKEQILFDG